MTLFTPPPEPLTQVDYIDPELAEAWRLTDPEAAAALLEWALAATEAEWIYSVELTEQDCMITTIAVDASDVVYSEVRVPDAPPVWPEVAALNAAMMQRWAIRQAEAAAWARAKTPD